MKYIAIKIIQIYQIGVSPLLPPSCRFEPTCSQYTLEALEKYGFLKGVFWGIKRLARCHPFSKHNHGYDPVPVLVEKPKNYTK